MQAPESLVQLQRELLKAKLVELPRFLLLRHQTLLSALGL